MEANPGTEARALAWSRYWKSGARHSCVGSFADHYGEATRRFWLECFAHLIDADRVLELGCGNGSLIRWLAEAGVRWPASVDAVDLAELNANWLARLPSALGSRVRLHPRTPATQLPLPDASVTQVWSQDALEYFADGACWQSLARVCAPRARLAAIVHHRGSHLCRLAQAERDDGDWLLAPDGPLDRASALLPWLAVTDAEGRARRDADQRAAAARERFNTSFAAVGERIAAAAFPDLLRDAAERAMRVLQAAPAIGETAARKALEALRADLADNRLRVAELATCALDRSGIEDWAQQLQQMGFASVAIGEIVERNYLFGWSLVASRDGRQGNG